MHPAIASAIAVDLSAPEFSDAVSPRRESIAVPEITVSKHNDFPPWENEIRFAR
jgi:hypothetical protein